MKQHAWVGVFILVLILGPIIHAATTATTLFVFNVPTNRGHTITYGGNCNANRFFFNETDANFDPDTDGNGTKVRPSPVRRTTVTTDYNYVPITAPSTTHMASGGFITSNPPGDNNSPTGEINNAGYGNIEADDTGYVTRETSTDGQYPAFRLTFKALVHPGRVRDFNFWVKGQGTFAENPAVCAAGSTSPGYDLNAYVWNYRTGVYDYLDGNNMGGYNTEPDGQVISALASQKIRNGIFSDYVSTSDGNITILVVGNRVPDGRSCLTVDVASLGVTHIPDATDYCQSETLAPITITNVGNADINVDGNFSSAFSGADTNIVLKVWQGTGSGCGTDGNGMGGWQKNCGVTIDTNAPNVNTCRNFNEFTATAGARLITRLPTGDTNQLCFSGEFDAFVNAGDHNKVFQTGSDFS